MTGTPAPGLSGSCGHHCAVRAGDGDGRVIHEGHCTAACCHARPGAQPPPFARQTRISGQPAPAGRPAGTPMCAR